MTTEPINKFAAWNLAVDSFITVDILNEKESQEFWETIDASVIGPTIRDMYEEYCMYKSIAKTMPENAAITFADIENPDNTYHVSMTTFHKTSGYPQEVTTTVPNFNTPTTMTPAGSFMNVKPGDTVVREFYGVFIDLLVESVDDKIIYSTNGWMFDRETGFEHDPEIGMGIEFGTTCSRLIEVKHAEI